MEGGATLADALLDDLDDLSDNEAEPEEGEHAVAAEETIEENNKTKNDNEDAVMKQDNTDDGDDSDDKPTTATKPKRLLDSSSLQQHLQQIRDAPPSSTGITSKEQQQAEHYLIVQSNKHLANLADELARAHHDVCECYKPKFPELEELLPNPVQYKNAVQIIGNELDIAKVSDALHSNGILNSNQIITLSVAGSTTSGRMLTETELQALNDAVSYVEEILKVQNELTTFVEGRMESLAPSVCALVGPTTAAKLIGLTGGLAELSKIPACNLQVLGQVKHTSTSRAGMSSVHTRPHQGVLAECDLVQRTRPQSLQKKVLKTVAAKLALAARCDFVNVDTGRTRSDASGRKFRLEIEGKINKWQEPDKAPVLKALPK